MLLYTWRQHCSNIIMFSRSSMQPRNIRGQYKDPKMLECHTWFRHRLGGFPRVCRFP